MDKTNELEPEVRVIKQRLTLNSESFEAARRAGWRRERREAWDAYAAAAMAGDGGGCILENVRYYAALADGMLEEREARFPMGDDLDVSEGKEVAEEEQEVPDA